MRIVPGPSLQDIFFKCIFTSQVLQCSVNHKFFFSHSSRCSLLLLHSVVTSLPLLVKVALFSNPLHTFNCICSVTSIVTDILNLRKKLYYLQKVTSFIENCLHLNIGRTFIVPFLYQCSVSSFVSVSMSMSLSLPCPCSCSSTCLLSTLYCS
jgi:hypothetical protein